MGLGYSGIEKFGTVMNMDVLSRTSYFELMKSILHENKSLQEEVLRKSRKAVRAAHMELDPTLAEHNLLDIVVYFDGSWPKRGHSSLIGFAAVIDILTGLVIDFVILSKFCHVCSMQSSLYGEDSQDFKDCEREHKVSGLCDKNYSGSSESMEMVAAEILWKRSIPTANMRYQAVVCDGDSKTIIHLNNVKPYGESYEIKKEDCVKHMNKRLGTALRNLVHEEKARKITLGGKKPGSLKETTMTTLQSYYRKAIMNHMPDIAATQDAILATIHHMNSTDDNPRHDLCPTNVSPIWCFYNRAIAYGLEPKSHEEMSCVINDLVFEKVLPIYKRLSVKELLERCTRLGTQNSNESLHSVVWSKCPKEVFFSKKIYDLGATRAVGEFNMGTTAMVEIKRSLREEECPVASLKIAKTRDERRMKQSDAQVRRTSKRAINKLKRRKASSTAKKAEGPTYAPGMF